jgi:hypothetical protein
MRPSLAAAAVVALAAARPAHAGPELALRLGVAQAVGDAAADVPVADAVPFQVPVQLDALWREGPGSAGLYVSWGPARAGRCASGATCSASVLRLGIQGTWAFGTSSGAEPWVGLAAGYAWARQEQTRGGTIATTWAGFEPIAVQGGIEWRLARWLALGPCALAGLGRYSRYAVDTGFDSGAVEIPEKAFHAWFHLGVRGRFVLGGGP